VLEREIKANAPAVWGGYAVAAVSLVLLAILWTMFFLSTKVTTTLLAVNTPVLVGLLTISALLPALIRLKLPGFEADLEAGTGAISPGPTGQVTFGPGRFSIPTGGMERLRGPFRQHVHRPAGLDIDQDRAVDVPTAQREVIDAEDLGGAACWVRQGADQPQQRGPAGRARQPPGQPGTGPAAQR
jgi:hypothetical protein